MKYFVAILFFAFSVVGQAQITKNPPIKRKSTNDTFVNRIEITEDYTILSMQYVAKSAEEQLKEYYNKRPKEKEEMARMSPLIRNLYLQQLLQQMQSGFSTISIQPSSYLLGANGEKFKYIKASNIPEAPDRMDVEPGKKYFFKVYFEKLTPGISSVDLIESDRASDGDMTYWNFYGISVNNPAVGEEAPSIPDVEETIVVEEKMLTIKGKVLDLDTNEPIQAKLVCKTDGIETVYDSVVTSRTGYYEFYIPNTTTTYIVSAQGYDGLEQTLDLSTKKGNELEYNFYLEKPYKVEKPEVEIISSETKEETPEAEIEVIDDNKLRLNNVYFALGKDEILIKSYPELDKLLKLLEEKGQMRIRVEGHTDNQGDPRKNMVLSLDRAIAVRNYLVSKGIDPERIEFKGFGDTKPIVDNNDEQLRYKNRRVEVVILED